MANQGTRIRKARAEAAKAEEFIEAATEAATKPAKKRGEWPCTADQLVAERDTAGRSWAQVAINLGLGSPGQARKAYSALVRPHHESQMSGKRASRAAVKGRTVDSPGWNDDSDQDEIEARLNGTWVEASGEPGGKNYMPAHWSGSDIAIRRTVGEHVYEEEIQVKYVTEFSFGRGSQEGLCPLAVTFIDRYTGGFRTVGVAEIIEVR